MTRRSNNKRFLGNTNTKEVHDLDNEDTSGSGCQINEIILAGHEVYFAPDTLVQARSEGYDTCAKCLTESRR